mgnify:CR=1 FL=1
MDIEKLTVHMPQLPGEGEDEQSKTDHHDPLRGDGAKIGLVTGVVGVPVELDDVLFVLAGVLGELTAEVHW